jgi:hypothetical protein
MNKKVKQKWIQALESGEYKQICSYTIDPDILDMAKDGDTPKKYKNMCVLGVLMNIYREDKGIPLKDWDKLAVRGDNEFPNRKVLSWAGLTNNQAEELMEDNDDKAYTFPEMATRIKTTL